MDLLKDSRPKIVSKGYTQPLGIDYHETFSLVAKMNIGYYTFIVGTCGLLLWKEVRWKNC